MKKTFRNIIAGIFTFLIGVGMVGYFVFRPSYDLATSKNICQKCLDVSKTEHLETKTLDELKNDKSLYGKKVRLEAVLDHDAGYLTLTDNRPSGLRLAAGFDSRMISCSETEKTFRVCTGYKNWYDGDVALTVVGYVGEIDGENNTFQGGEEGFNIVCIERVNATDEDLKRGKRLYETNLLFADKMRK